MKSTKVIIAEELSDSVEATQLELAGVKDLIGFALSTTEYNIPVEKINALEKEYKELYAKYDVLKNQVERIAVPEDYDTSKSSWSLDFATHTVTVTEND